MEVPDWVPEGVTLDRPNAARIYDYLLGGGCHFDVDRAFAEEILAINPDARNAARENRAFLRRSVRYCVARGIRQFLDIGSGIPTVGNVHEIAQDAAPECRVVYVDNEPMAVAHSELMLDGNDKTGVVMADLADPVAILTSDPVRRLLDLDEPVSVMMAAVLHFVADKANPYQAVARYVHTMSPGSYLTISHAMIVRTPQMSRATALYNQRATQLHARTYEDVVAFFAGTELVEPGLVRVSEWRPHLDAYSAHPEQALSYGGIGRKR
jgi:S-adenosyl methyltransferase